MAIQVILEGMMKRGLSLKKDSHIPRLIPTPMQFKGKRKVTKDS
ncbi:hypothetical protein ACFLWG_01825 [Chloroflexota bacterium]